MRRAVVLGLLMACGSDGDDSGTEPTGAWPADSSLQGIADYVNAGKHREAPWIAETAAPRDENTQVSPHDRVRVWANDVLVDSQKAGNGQVNGSAHPTGAMTVKELYDSADTLVGYAVMLKIAGDAEEWAYYCDGSEAQCGATMPSNPLWGVGLDTDCGFCHGGLVFNEF